MAQIHPTAVVDKKAELAQDVTIGAYAIIRDGVKIGPGTVVFEHSCIEGETTIGRNCRIGPSAFVGMAPQHLKHDGKGTAAIIGDDVVIREMASVHRSIKADPGVATRVGNRCWLMATSHVGHDSAVGDDVILANAVLLGGHTQIGERAFLGGGAVVHQFCRVGRLSIVGGNETVTQDVPPFAAARYGGLKGYNAIGCKRASMSPETIFAIRGAFRCYHSHRTMTAVIDAIRKNVKMVPEVEELLQFFTSTKRGIRVSVGFTPILNRAAKDDESEVV